MNLKQYLGKNVKVIKKDGSFCKGFVDSYTTAANNNGKEPAITVSNLKLKSGCWVDESDIAEIEVMG